jgi:hypothetical protein
VLLYTIQQGYRLVSLAGCVGVPAYQSVQAPGIRDVSYQTFYIANTLECTLPYLSSYLTKYTELSHLSDNSKYAETLVYLLSLRSVTLITIMSEKPRKT